MAAKIWNKRDKNARGIYVGRPTKFGNPFSHLDGTLAKFKVASREEAIARYREWIWKPEQKALRNDIRQDLRGTDLICWCAPLACHAEVIAEVAQTPFEE